MSLDVVTLALAKSYANEHQFTLDFETTSVEKNINNTTDYKLSLIATKRDNSYYASAPYGQLPVDIGYLYMDEITQKLYYSAVKYDRPKYLCDWQTQIGDKNFQLHILMSTDNGETFVDQTPTSVVGNYSGTSLRFVGLVFTKDYIYYLVDDQATHAFFRFGRDASGFPDVSSLEKICDLSTGVAGYGVMLSREPYGIFLLDKRESDKTSTVNTIEYKFYSLVDEKMYSLGTFNAIDGYALFEQQGRFGLPARAISIYQSPYEDGLIMGTPQAYKPLTLDILNNNKHRIIGVVKAKIKQIK